MPAYTIRLSDDLRKAVRVAAAEKDKSMNQWIVDTLSEAINKNNKKKDAMRLSEIIEKMGERESVEAPGSETTQWQHFVDECRREYGATPWQIGDTVPDPIVDSDFAAYWTAIAENRFKDAEEHGEVPEDWYLDLEDN